VDKAGNPYSVDELGVIYKRSTSGSTHTWTKFSDADDFDAKQIAINSNDDIWKISKLDGKPYKRSGSTWTVSGTDKAISLAAGADAVYIVTPAGQVRKTVDGTAWTDPTAHLSEAVSVGHDGTVYIISRGVLGSQTGHDIKRLKSDGTLSDAHPCTTGWDCLRLIPPGISSFGASPAGVQWATDLYGQVHSKAANFWIRQNAMGNQVAFGPAGATFVRNDAGEVVAASVVERVYMSGATGNGTYGSSYKRGPERINTVFEKYSSGITGSVDSDSPFTFYKNNDTVAGQSKWWQGTILLKPSQTSWVVTQVFIKAAYTSDFDQIAGLEVLVDGVSCGSLPANAADIVKGRWYSVTCNKDGATDIKVKG
jgi:hypothetical protein